jgi:putative transposase
MQGKYQIATALDSHELTEFLVKDGQFLLPMMQLIVEGKAALDDFINVVGKASIQAVLVLSAMKVAGDKHKGKTGGDIRWHGQQKGVVPLKERKLRVNRPRLRKKGGDGDGGEGAEVPIPAYEALAQNSQLGERMLEILMHGVSTRNYKEVLPEMAESVGISKSAVSRKAVEASGKLLEELARQDFSDKDILIVYLDGLRFGSHHVLGAVGVDAQGHKHVLGLCAGASENTTTVTALLEDLVQRGIKPGRRRLFVIDGAKALRNGIAKVYGDNNPVQRCRNHKVRNVLEHLPKDQHAQVRSTFKAAWKLEAPAGIKRLEQLACWYEKEYPSAAGSLREGLTELFTINALGLPTTLRRCLGSTNLIDSSHSGIRQKTNRVTNWQDGQMALRWAASAMEATAKHFRRIMGYQQLWMLKAHLDEAQDSQNLAAQRKAG